MAQMTAAEFEALWQEAQKGPVVREAAVQPIQFDTSLSGALDRYGTIADGFLEQGKISQVEHDTLMAAIAALKAVLTAIKEKELIAQHIAETTKTVQQEVQDKINTLLGVPGRPT